MDHHDSDHDLSTRLRVRGQRVTSQRLVIYRELCRRDAHRTADEVLGAVRRDLPGTSAPTIYATLDLLVELGLVRRIDAGTGAALYDARLAPHHHAVCRRCRRVEDVEAGLATDAVVDAAADQGFAAEGVEVVVTGICAACRAAVPA